MAWYYGTFSCGCEGRVNVIGPMKDRQWKIDRAFERMCEDCYVEHLQREREKANKEAAEKAREMELPELAGSEKQIAWANTLRQKLIDSYEARAELAESRGGNRESAEDILDFILRDKTDAKWYIDNRFDLGDIDGLFRRIQREIPTEEDLIEKARIADVEAEALITPENAITTSVATIKEIDGRIVATFEKNDTFIGIVKKLGYSWGNGAWRKTITKTTGTATERIAELGNKLLAEGFPIRIYDHIARERAVNADYEPEHTRWIYIRTRGNYEGRLVIRWAGMSDTLYKTARKLPTSRWNNGVVVKVEKYEEVEEFARLYSFRFSEGAIEAIEKHKQALENSVVAPADPKETETKDGLKEILESSTEVLEDLRDD